MKVGILGAGAIGRAFAGQFVKVGHEVILSNSRGPQSLAALVADLGPRATAGTVADAARADIALLAVPWRHVSAALENVESWEGRILVDTTNPIVMPGFQIANLGERTSSEVVAALAPGARLVKAGNTLPPETIAADPHVAGGRRVLFLSGNDAQAKTTVSELFEEMGFAAIDLGSLEIGGRLQQFPDGPLPVHDLIKRN